jgi:hypothetical protein
MYRCVVARSVWPASCWMAVAGAPRVASVEQNVCRRMWIFRDGVSPALLVLEHSEDGPNRRGKKAGTRVRGPHSPAVLL